MQPNPLTKTIATESDMLALGAKLAQATDRGVTIFLHGLLGAGKTTFTRGFLRACGYEGKVKSPTYTLVEPYELVQKTIYHFDLYRLNDAQELIHIGVEEYFNPASICLVEWPEKGQPLLPPPDITCFIEFIQLGREVSFKAYSKKGEAILRNMNT